MNVVWRIFKKHPIAIVFFLLYTWLCIRTLEIQISFHERLKHRKPGESGIMLGGEGVAYSDVFLVLVGGVFFLVIAGFAIGNKIERKFYLLFGLMIVIETVATLNVN
jgi:hypothetical protein